MHVMSKGFTLIELMIVVAIIGILMAIAIPQYQSYIARSEVGRAYGEVAHYRSGVETFLNYGNVTFNEVDLGWSGSSLASKADLATPTAGDGLEIIGWSTGSGYGYLKVTLGDNASVFVAGTAIYIEREQSGDWACQVDKGVAAAWDVKYLPTGCSLLADGATPTDD